MRDRVARRLSDQWGVDGESDSTSLRNASSVPAARRLEQRCQATISIFDELAASDSAISASSVRNALTQFRPDDLAA